MLFSKEYDDTLWLILSGGKKNVECVTNFVRYIPAQIFIQIQNSLKLYKENKLEKTAYGAVESANDMFYWYKLNVDDGMLELGESCLIDENQIDVHYLSLVPYNKEVCDFMRTYDYISLGEFRDIYDPGYDYDIVDEEVEFSLIKLPFNRMQVESCKILPSLKIRNRKVDIASIPENYCMRDLSDNRVKDLVRRRKKKNSK